MVSVEDVTKTYYPTINDTFRLLQVGKKNKEGRITYSSFHKFFTEPTGNCQMSVLGNVMGFLNNSYKQEEIKEILADIAEQCDTNALLVDIPKHHLKYLEQAITDNYYEIIFSNHYINLTGTPMVIVYIKFEDYLDDNDEDYDEDYDEDDLF